MTRWQKIGLAALIIVLGITVLIAMGFRAKTDMRNLLYPLAPPMPAVVSKPMPEILARLDAVLKTNAPSVFAELQPGLSANAIAGLEKQYHVQIPDDIKAIYEWHDGSASTTNRLSDDFIPIHRFPPLEESLANKAMEWKGATAAQRAVAGALTSYRDSWICLFDDGAGNGYWYDPQRKPSEGAIFCQFTEDASFVFFPSAKNLMAGIAKCYESGAFRIKPGSTPPDLDEDFQLATKIWTEFGASNLPPTN
ncbi:MAG TPA: SMI1/KNR4 family protein [Candidatus Acidoferrales bacterium]|jgi:cell wall assembly regulator SMI1|nr:SMI1/KNR4 family protein [Candidatus Acidoferrales bacterium]